MLLKSALKRREVQRLGGTLLWYVRDSLLPEFQKKTQRLGEVWQVDAGLERRYERSPVELHGGASNES